MKAIRILVLAVVVALSCPLTASAQARLTLKDGNISYEQGGAQKVLMKVEAGGETKVQNSNLVFVTVEDAAALQAAGYQAPGLFFFDKGGALTAYFPGSDSFDPAMCAAASLSPDGKIIALDNGTWLVRIWAFFNYPDFTPLTTEDDPFVSYLTQAGWLEGGRTDKDLAWVDSDTVIITDLSEAPVGRPCDSDPCEPTDVVVHYLTAWRSQALAKGSELCDYRFNSLSGDTVTVDKVCVKTLDDWQDSQKPRAATREKIQVPR